MLGSYCRTIVQAFILYVRKNDMQFLSLTKQYKLIKKEIDSSIRRVLKSTVFIGGREVEEFEKEMAMFCGAKYAIGVNSGTDAIFLALKSLNIKDGDEVITTPFTFIATAGVIHNCGARPVFVDIDPKTFNIDYRKIEEKITPRTKAIVPVHIFGQPADMEEIIAIAKRHNLSIIEDAAQAVGANYKGRKAGTIGDLGCFSFFPSKNLGAYGDGGMIVTNNKDLADQIRLLKNHGSSPKEKYFNLIIGTNSRLDSIQAAVLRVKLKHLVKWSKKRGEKAYYYDKNLNRVGDVITPFVDKNRDHIFHQYTIRVKNRDGLRCYLERKGIPSMIYYPLPLHLQPAFKYLGLKKGDYPVAEAVSNEVLSLPIYPELSVKDQREVIESIKEFYERKSRNRL